MLGWCGETTLVAAALAALVVLVGRWSRWTAEARHALWLVVLTKFLVPPVVAWPWAWNDSPPAVAVGVAVGGQPSAPPGAAPRGDRTATPPEPVVADPAAIPEIETDHSEPAPLAVVARGAEVPPFPAREPRPEPPASLPAAAPVRPVVARRVAWRSALLLFWLVGTLGALARGASRIARFRRLMAGAIPAPAALRAEVATVAARLGVEPPPVLVVAALPTPLLWCLGAPRLVVPDSLGSLPGAARTGLLAHELAHLARRDHWVVRLELLAGLVWWWNPVFRFAHRRLRVEAENACDARVVRAFPEHRFAYAEALIQVCEHHAWPVPPLPALGIGGASAARTLEARLMMILRDPIRPPSRWLAPLALALLGLSIPTWTLGQQAPTPPAQPSPADSPRVEVPAAEPGVPSSARPAESAHSPRRLAMLQVYENPDPRLQARRNIQAAEVVRAQAERDRAKAIADRTVALLQRHAGSQSEADDAVANLKVAEAVVLVEQAKLAEVDLAFVPAPTRTVDRTGDPISILQARRAAQTAEVQRFEAERDQAKIQFQNTEKLMQRKGVSQVEVDLYQNRLRAAEAALAREQAKLAEADLLVGQAQPAATPRLGDAVGNEKPLAVLGDYRDLVELAQMQVEIKEVELQQAQARAGQAKKILDAHEPLVKEGRITQSKWVEVQNNYGQAQDEVKVKEVAGREARLRREQAIRRVVFEEGRVKRLAERAKSRLEWSRNMFQKGYVSQATFMADLDRYDDLMTQLDPKYKPEPEPLLDQTPADFRTENDLKMELLQAEADLAEAENAFREGKMDAKQRDAIRSILDRLRSRREPNLKAPAAAQPEDSSRPAQPADPS